MIGVGPLGWAAGQPGGETSFPVRRYVEGLPGVHAPNPEMRLSLGRDPELGAEPVLMVSYPRPTDDPASRDVWCEAESKDWSAAQALTFRIRPDDDLKLSVSFFDRNRVVYSKWIELRGGVWQPVHIRFDELQPNPYFQPPEARRGAPLDRSEVPGLGFAPQSPAAGRFEITEIGLSR